MLVRTENLTKLFPVGLSLLRRPRHYVHAVNSVSFDVRSKEILGLAGESGCGKTTTGRLLLRLTEATSGAVYYRGVNIFDLKYLEMLRLRHKMQAIFQDPFESLNPRMRIFDIVNETNRIHKLASNRVEAEEMIHNILEAVGLSPPKNFYNLFPHELSGGQRQRVAIARIMLLKPEFVVADEPVSMLDASVRAEVLNLMLDLRRRFGLTYLFITHDLALARHLCDRIAVMYLGNIVETGNTEEIVYKPLHPYTMALISAVPKPDPKDLIDVSLTGEVPSAISPPLGCKFHPRCPYQRDLCQVHEPKLIEFKREHYVACHRVDQIRTSLGLSE